MVVCNIEYDSVILDPAGYPIRRQSFIATNPSKGSIRCRGGGRLLQTESNYKYYIMFINAQRSLLATSISLGSGPGADLAVLEAPAAQVRITDPPPGWVFGRAQPHRTESLRRPPIIAASRAASLPDRDTPDLAARRVLPIEAASQRGALGQKLPASPPQLRGQLLTHSSADPSIHCPEWMCWGSCDRG